MTSPHTTSRRSRSTPSLQQLVVSEQLTALSLASWAHLDEEGGAEVHRYFTPAGLWDLGSVRYRGREEIREAMRRRAAGAPSATCSPTCA